MKKLIRLSLILLASAAYGADQSERYNPDVERTAAGNLVIRSGCPYIEDATYAVTRESSSTLPEGNLVWGIIRFSGCPFVEHIYGWVPAKKDPDARL
jgi:hypothetical protein